MENDAATAKADIEGDPSISALVQHACIKFDQYQDSGDVSLLQEAYGLAYMAAQPSTALQSHPQRSQILECYHIILQEKFLVIGSPKDLVDGIMCMNQSIDFLPEDDPYATTVVNSMMELAMHFPGTSLTPKVIAPGDTEERDLTRAQLLTFVGDVYQMRFKITSNVQDLSLSCVVMGQALDCSPTSNPVLLDWCLMLGTRCRIVYERTADLKYVTARIQAIQKGISLLSDNTPSDRRAHVLEQYADGLQARAKRTGSIDDLTQAISYSTEAVSNEPDQVTKRIYTMNLANRLEDRFERTGRLDDLLEAIQADRASVALTTTDVAMSCTTLHNLGAKLFKLHRRSADERYFDEGFSLIKQAIESMPSIDSVPAIWLNSASSGFRHQYLQQGRQEDLEMALKYQKMALERLPRGHVELPDYLNNMASLLQLQAAVSQSFDGFLEAVNFSEQALDVIPEGHVRQASVLYSLARIYTSASVNRNHGIYEVEVDGTRWTPFWEDKALEFYLKCLDCQSGNPTIRMGAAKQVMLILEKRGQYLDAAEIGVKALDVLHKTNSRSLSREDQEHITADFSNIAVEACALSLSADQDAARALEILEMGRGAILGLLIEERSDISELAASYPAQAARFRELRDEIRAPLDVDVYGSSRQEFVARRDRSIAQLDELLQEIRTLPDQEAFLRGPTKESLKKQAADGPIIVVNIGTARSDAIIVSPSDILGVRLPELTKESVIELMVQEPTRWKSRPERGRKNNLYREFLQWLWNVCVKPILDKLSLANDSTPASPPRVWWIGTGVASLLPFHAAGDHSPGSTANTYSHVISSYAPTIKALKYAKERAEILLRTATQHQPELMMVLMPTTPAVDGQVVSDLSVADEDAAIKEAVGSNYAIRRLDRPSCKFVLEGLADCDMVHFACHGVSEAKNPSNSFLILQTSGEGHPNQATPAAAAAAAAAATADKLTVKMVSQAVFERARICYLSACSTAENRSTELVDEVIHLASGFQVAGFPHVIGALWPSDDATSVLVAKEFYKELLSGAAVEMANDDQDNNKNRTVASALHAAVMRVRARYPRQPLLWAQYVHVGA